MLDRLISLPVFGLALSIVAYVAGCWIRARVRSSVANPFIIAILLVLLFLWLTGTSYERFYHGGRMLTLFLGPATASLAVLVYRLRAVLRRAWLPILAGCFVGSLVSLVTVYFGCMWLGLDGQVTASMLPKSVTTPIAVSLSEERGGVEALTTAVLCVTGLVGVMFFPLLLRLFRVRDGVVQGVAIGMAAHAIGTARAVEMGELQGAVSGIAIGVAGVITTVLYLFLPAV